MSNIILDQQKIIQNGWKQGACIRIDDDHEKWQKLNIRKNELYIVLSQDCDITNPNLQKEPIIELILAVEIKSCNSEFQAGKNPRELHIAIIIGNENKSFKILPQNRVFLPRQYLEDLIIYDYAISEKSLKILISWFTKRYKRPGFPHAFNNRINIHKGKIMDQIKAILDQEARESYGLFIRLDTDKELDDAKKYKLIVVMLVDKENFEDTDKLRKIENGYNRIIDLLLQLDGIEIITAGSQVQSTDDISFYKYQQLKQWDFDYLCFLNGENGFTIPEI